MESPGRRRPLVTTLVVLIVLAIAGGGAYWYWDKSKTEQAAKDATGPKGAIAGKGKGKGGFDPNRATPVVGEAAKIGEINVYLNGLGTIVPLRTVTVRSRVEGELQKVLFTEGQTVKAGDVLAEIDPRPFQVQLAQAEGQAAKDQAALANARIDLERYQTLFKQDSIAKQQVDTQAALVRQFEGTIRANEAQVQNARLQLTYAKIVAPISGRLGLRQVDPGNVVRGGDANGIVVITQLQPVSAVFNIPQDALPSVIKRVRDKLPVEAWDRENRNKVASGTLITIDNQIDPATGTVKVKAEFPNADGSLFANQFVNIKMLVETRRDLITVSTSALQRGARGEFVYVVKPDATVTVRPVKTGPTEAGRIAIESGVAEGEVVVTDGVDRLREGAKVEVSGARPVIDMDKKKGERGSRKKGPPQ